MRARTGRVPATVTWGLFVAWCLHDLEELPTMPGWVGRNRARLRRRLPWVPEKTWDRLNVSAPHARTAIGLMGLLMLAASAAGARTGGRSSFYQSALAGFGFHAVTHVAQSALTGGYTPGVLTAPTVVAPFSWWAWRQLRAAGVANADQKSAAGAVLLLAGSLAGVHAVAGMLHKPALTTKIRDRARSRRPVR